MFCSMCFCMCSPNWRCLWISIFILIQHRVVLFWEMKDIFFDLSRPFWPNDTFLMVKIVDYFCVTRIHLKILQFSVFFPRLLHVLTDYIHKWPWLCYFYNIYDITSILIRKMMQFIRSFWSKIKSAKRNKKQRAVKINGEKMISNSQYQFVFNQS